MPSEDQRSRYRTTRNMRIGAGVLAVLFILPYLVVAFLYPVEGLSLYLRFVGLGLFFALVWYSLRKERRGEPARSEEHEHRVARRLARENRMRAVSEGDLPASEAPEPEPGEQAPRRDTR